MELPRAAGTAELPDAAATTQPQVRDPGEPAANDVADDHPTADSDARVAEPAVASTPSRWTKTRIVFVAAGAVASFVLAFALITGIESVSGSSLSGGGRTTLGELGGDGASDPGTDTEDVDAPEQPVLTPEPTSPAPSVTDPPDGDQRDTVPPPGDAPELEQPPDQQPPSPSPTESPTSESTEPPADDGRDSPASSADSETTG